MQSPKSTALDPRQEYETRWRQRRQLVERLDRLDLRFSLARAASIVFAIIVGWAVFDPDRLHIAWLALPLSIFVLLVVLHERVARQRRCAIRAAAYYERGLARFDDRWEGEGFSGRRFRDDDHPYANDLDLFGDGSLYQLLCAARTGIGRRTLADWLLAPAGRDEVEQRQAAARELATSIDLREDLAVFGEEMVNEVHPRELIDWASSPATLTAPAYRWLAPALVVLLISAAVGLLFGVSGRLALGAAFVAHVGFALSLRGRVDRVITDVARAANELRLLGGVLERIERREFTSPRLQRLTAELRHDETPPSTAIAHLQRLIDLLDSRRNQFFAPIALVLLWGTQCALAIERWRQMYGEVIERWLASIGEFEALASLGAYHYEHPDDPFPEIVDEGPVFDARLASHPLLPRGEAVRNDLRLDSTTRLLVVSGSNMSGKSTLMRTVGANCVLAMTGAPVRARALRVSPLWVGGTLRVQDSLRRGMSGFYAEIERFRQLVELADQQPPLLFLLEEILNTTNSHDRRIGANAVLRSLLERGAIGLVTTHDLAITEIVEPLTAAANVHFVDHLEENQVRFDYVLRPGVVSKSNAIELMRSIGLDV